MNSPQENHTSYQSLEGLVNALSNEEKSKYTDIIRSINLPLSAFENCCSWSDKGYTRNCIRDTDKFELILLCWEKGQVTPIHDHGGEECWVHIIQGKFRETVYNVDDLGELNVVKTNISNTGDVTYMSDFMGCHSLENLSDARSLSLHLYAKPIRNCNAFDDDLGEFVHKDLTYNTVFEFEDELT